MGNLIKQSPHAQPAEPEPDFKSKPEFESGAAAPGNAGADPHVLFDDTRGLAILTLVFAILIFLIIGIEIFRPH